MTYLLQFGSYQLPPTFYVSSAESNRIVPSAKLPRADGSRILVGYLDAKKITVRGAVVCASLSTGGGAPVRTQLDSLKAALASGPANFTTATDRYWRNCQVSEYSDGYEATEFSRIATVQFTVLSPDPWSYEVATQTPSRAITASGQTLAATNNGNAYAFPLFSVTVGATGTLSATITNSTTGESFTLNGAVTAGDVFVIDCLNQSVTRAGIDVTAYFDGYFLRLLPGANTITVAYTSSTLTNLALNWNNRWW